MGMKLFLGLIIIALGIAVGWYSFGGSAKLSLPLQPVNTRTTLNLSPTPSSAYTYQEVPTTGVPTPVGSSVTKGGIVTNNQPVITYGEKGFSPMILTVKLGTQVVFSNTSTKGMWVASNTSGLTGMDSLKSIPSGGSFTYIFTKVGTWKYFNNVQRTDTGTVIVTQ